MKTALLLVVHVPTRFGSISCAVHELITVKPKRAIVGMPGLMLGVCTKRETWIVFGLRGGYAKGENKGHLAHGITTVAHKFDPQSCQGRSRGNINLTVVTLSNPYFVTNRLVICQDRVEWTASDANCS